MASPEHRTRVAVSPLTVAPRDEDRPVRVLIVEDHVMVAEGLRTAIERAADIDVVGLASSLREACSLLGAVHPDVVVLDHPLPDAEAPVAIATFRALAPDVRVLVISALTDHRSVVQTIEAGADGYLSKDEPIDVLTTGIRSVHRGDRALSATLLTNLLARLVRSDAPSDRLSERQQDVLQCLVDGMSTDEIVEHLRLSRHTVRNQTQRILTRLGAHSKLEAVAIALREGLVRPPGLGVGSRPRVCAG
jgi:DNA-binding NarL/FixJ family response regulator